MNFYINLAISVLLQVVGDIKEAKKIYPALAKIFIKLEIISQVDPAFMAEVEHQRKKERGK